MTEETTKCHKCKEHINIEGLKLGHGWNKGLKGFRKGHAPYFVAYGEDNPAWKGGITPENAKIRNSSKYTKWRITVFERDNYTCQECGIVGGSLNADHIIPFSVDVDKRFDLDNGQTLCVDCHRKTPTYAGRVVHYGN